MKTAKEFLANPFAKSWDELKCLYFECIDALEAREREVARQGQFANGGSVWAPDSSLEHV